MAECTMTSSVVNVSIDGLSSVTLTNPVNNARFIAGTNLTLAASAAETGGSIAQVQFLAGTNLLGGVTNAPYSLVWSNVPAGAWAFTAQATDNNGLVSTYAVVNIVAAGLAITASTFGLLEIAQRGLLHFCNLAGSQTIQRPSPAKKTAGREEKEHASPVVDQIVIIQHFQSFLDSVEDFVLAELPGRKSKRAFGLRPPGD